jgi:hypothetical protein
MRKFTLSLLTLSLGRAAAVGAGGDDACPGASAGAGPLGEASNREDLVRQSLYRLELIDPNNPD